MIKPWPLEDEELELDEALELELDEELVLDDDAEPEALSDSDGEPPQPAIIKIGQAAAAIFFSIGFDIKVRLDVRHYRSPLARNM